LIDMAASGVADTVVLPYTGYQQYKLGNMVIPSFSPQLSQEATPSGSLQ
jgi:hypothetical protein